MSKRNLKKLSLHVEVLRTLTQAELDAAIGGAGDAPIKASDRQPCPMPSRYRQLCV